MSSPKSKPLTSRPPTSHPSFKSEFPVTAPTPARTRTQSSVTSSASASAPAPAPESSINVTNTTNADTSVLRPANAGSRHGRNSAGLYPHISRTLLGKLINRHVSTVTGILQGRTKVSLDLALKMAQAIGIPVEQFSTDLTRKQKRFQKEQATRK